VSVHEIRNEQLKKSAQCVLQQLACFAFEKNLKAEENLKVWLCRVKKINAKTRKHLTFPKADFFAFNDHLFDVFCLPMKIVHNACFNFKS